MAEHVPYPIFINLSGHRVVVVGAGHVAKRKIESLLPYGADVVVIAPEALDEVQALAEQGTVTWLKRPYAEGDLHDAFYCICATNDRDVNRTVFEEAEREKILVNVVDDPELCNAILPSTVKRGKLQIAISTAGAAPSVARNIRKQLDAQFAEHWEAYIDTMGKLRALIKERVPGAAERRVPIYEAITASDLEARFAAGQRPEPEHLYEELVVPILKDEA